MWVGYALQHRRTDTTGCLNTVILVDRSRRRHHKGSGQNLHHNYRHQTRPKQTGFERFVSPRFSLHGVPLPSRMGHAWLYISVGRIRHFDGAGQAFIIHSKHDFGAVSANRPSPFHDYVLSKGWGPGAFCKLKDERSYSTSLLVAGGTLP